MRIKHALVGASLLACVPAATFAQVPVVVEAEQIVDIVPRRSEIASNETHRIVDLVGHPRHQAAQSRHFLTLHKLDLHRLQLANRVF